MKRLALLLSVLLVLSVFWCTYLAYVLYSDPTSWIDSGIQLGFSGIALVVLLGFRLSVHKKSKTGLLWGLGMAALVLSLIQLLNPSSILSLWNYTLAVLALFIGSVLVHTAGRKLIYSILLVIPALITAVAFLLKVDLGIIYIIGTVFCVIALLVSAMSALTPKD